MQIEVAIDLMFEKTSGSRRRDVPEDNIRSALRMFWRELDGKVSGYRVTLRRPFVIISTERTTYDPTEDGGSSGNGTPDDGTPNV
jgi:hypothetical protein